jgi:predicted RNA-binding Zn ribbon-like protein
MRLIGGALCLDFANTADWHTSESPVELLRTYGDVLDWSIHAAALNTADAEALRHLAGERPTDAAEALERTRDLREVLFRLFTSVATASPVAPTDLAALNATLAMALPHRCITDASGSFTWHWNGLDEHLDAPLWPVVASAADLLVAPHRLRIGICADERCGWLFLDTSKSGRRCWCSMEDCGNRAKARRHYRRQRAAASLP